MARKYRGSSIKRQNIIEMYGVSELLKKLENAGGNVDEAVRKSVDASLKIVGKDMQSFMRKHEFTGETIRSYEEIPAYISGNSVNGMVGYNIKNGGLPAIFLDVGTPKQKGTFFRYYAVENHVDEIKEIQKSTIDEIFEELKR